jgi:hypothetical protein
MTAKVSCRASLECWSNVLSSAIGRLDLTAEVVPTRMGVAVAEQKRLLRNHARNAGRAEALGGV